MSQPRRWSCGTQWSIRTLMVDLDSNVASMWCSAWTTRHRIPFTAGCPKNPTDFPWRPFVFDKRKEKNTKTKWRSLCQNGIFVVLFVLGFECTFVLRFPPWFCAIGQTIAHQFMRDSTPVLYNWFDVDSILLDVVVFTFAFNYFSPPATAPVQLLHFQFSSIDRCWVYPFVFV